MSPKPPTGGGRLVDRAPHEGVPEAEPPGHVRRAEKIELQELVDSLHHRAFRKPGRGRRELGLERVSRHRGPFQDEACGVGQQRELLVERRADARGNSDRRRRRLVASRRRSTRSVERPGELLEIERIAAALRIQDIRVGGLDRGAE